MATIPFDPPHLLTARRKAGFVDVPETAPLGWDGNSNTGYVSNSPSPQQPRSSLAGPACLKRAQTMAGNIIMFEDESKPPQAFWLQRKIGKSSNGVIRLGYKLRPNSKPDFKDSADAWELATEESGLQPIVTINMMHSSVLDLKSEDMDVHNPLDELSALQMIAQHGDGENAHVVGTQLVATCSQHIYAILPYYPDGTLLQYCQMQGSLEESVARFFFRQILKGLKTLQEIGLCHRNLSLDAIELNGDHLDISRLGWSRRFNKNAPVDEDKPLLVPGGNTPQYLAPEYFGGSTGVWDGFAADLWASGVMLYSMVVSSEALFAAPIPEDRIFVELCVKGKIGAATTKYSKKAGNEVHLSDKLVDLLQRMLKVNPKERLSLDEVMKHPWVKDGEATAPSELVKNRGEETAHTEPNGEKETTP